MEYLIAVLALVATVGYAVFIAVNIEKGKSWALDIARAISMMDPDSVDHYLRYQLEREEVSQVQSEPPSDRMAA